MGRAQKNKYNVGAPAKIEENPYGKQNIPEKIKLPSVPAPSKKQMGEIALGRLRNEIEIRHSSRGRALPKKLMEQLEEKATSIYNASRKASLERAKNAEKERGFELTGGQKIKIWKKEYTFAVLREMEEYYLPEAEKRVDALVKTLGKEDRKAIGKMKKELASQMARRLALNPNESFSRKEMEETIWATKKLARTLEEMYGKEIKWLPEKAQSKLTEKAFEIYSESRKNATQEISGIERGGGTLSPAQKIIVWELEYKKTLQMEVRKLREG